MADYETHTVFERQKKLLSEQASEASLSMDTTPQVANQSMIPTQGSYNNPIASGMERIRSPPVEAQTTSQRGGGKQLFHPNSNYDNAARGVVTNTVDFHLPTLMGVTNKTTLIRALHMVMEEVGCSCSTLPLRFSVCSI